jgi:hypothetical protein
LIFYTSPCSNRSRKNLQVYEILFSQSDPDTESRIVQGHIQGPDPDQNGTGPPKLTVFTLEEKLAIISKSTLQSTVS